MQNTVYQTHIHPLRGKYLRNPICRFNKELVVQLIEIIFILEHLVHLGEGFFQWVLRSGGYVPINQPAKVQPTQCDDKRYQQGDEIELQSFWVLQQGAAYELVQPVWYQPSNCGEVLRDTRPTRGTCKY